MDKKEAPKNQDQETNKQQQPQEEEKSKSYLLTKADWNELKFLNKEILDQLLAHDYNYPSKIQYVSFQQTLDPKNDSRMFLIKAPNGTGKTLTFSIPALQKIDLKLPIKIEKQEKKNKKQGKKPAQDQQQFQNEENEKYYYAPQAVIVSETALQVDQVQKYITKLIPESWQKQCEVNILYGAKKLELVGQILVTTPELLSKLVLKYDKISLENLKFFAVDEADANMNNKESDLLDIFYQIQLLFKKGKNIQVIMTSATWNQKIVRNLEQKLYKVIEIGFEHTNPDQLEGVTQYYYQLNNKQLFSQRQKDEEDFCDVIIDIIYLISIEKKLNTQIIIFMNELKRIKEFVEKLKKSKVSGVKFDQIDSTIGDHNHKIAKLQEFRDQKFQILFTTNIMSRGIDIRTVGLVINVGTPRLKHGGLISYETYLHRIARTGRFSDKGVALTLMTMKKHQNQEQTVEDEQLIHLVDKHYNQKLKELVNIDLFINDIQDAIINNQKEIVKQDNDKIQVVEVDVQNQELDGDIEDNSGSTTNSSKEQEQQIQKQLENTKINDSKKDN